MAHIHDPNSLHGMLNGPQQGAGHLLVRDEPEAQSYVLGRREAFHQRI